MHLCEVEGGRCKTSQRLVIQSSEIKSFKHSRLEGRFCPWEDIPDDDLVCRDCRTTVKYDPEMESVFCLHDHHNIRGSVYLVIGRHEKRNGGRPSLEIMTATHDRYRLEMAGKPSQLTGKDLGTQCADCQSSVRGKLRYVCIHLYLLGTSRHVSAFSASVLSHAAEEHLAERPVKAA